MKIETDNNTLAAVGIVAVTTIIITAICVCMNYHKTALEKGYVEKQMTSQSTLWTKP